MDRLEKVNKIRELFTAIEEQRLEDLDKMMTDDLVWIVPGNTKVSGAHKKQTFIPMIPYFNPHVTGPIRFTLGEPLVDGERASLVAESHQPFKDGTMYDNHYHFLFTFRGNQISSVVEYMDTKYLVDTLGHLMV